MRYIKQIVSFMMILVFTMTLGAVVNAQTLEEYLNNIIGPTSQYDTEFSPAYTRNNKTEEYISPQSGDLKLTYTDYVLEGINGLDLEIKRIYSNSQSNIYDMNTEYVNGVWVDYTENMESSFYEERYNLGVGMRFSFPMIEIRDENMYLHSESGDTYKIKESETSSITYYLDGHVIEDIVIKEDYSYSTLKWTDNQQSTLTSKYMMVEKNGKKTYFDDEGRILGIVDRYGNNINFEYSALKHETYTDANQNRKVLITKITDTVGREIYIDYSYDSNYSLTLNGDGSVSEDLGNNFQVIIYLPDDTTSTLTDNDSIIYNKSLAHYEDLGAGNYKLWRTKIDKVYDTDTELKYNYTWDKQNNGFTFTNSNSYSINNIYWNIIQVDFAKSNKIVRYEYGTYTKALGDDGSMQYNKVIKKQDLSQTGWHDTQANYLDKFICDIENEITYEYINEPSGYGFADYHAGNENYLRDTYRYYSKKTDTYGVTITHTYNGLGDLLNTESKGNDHKIVTTTTYDEYNLPEKKETKTYNVVDGIEIGSPLIEIENYDYDEYGNLVSYTGKEAERDTNGNPINAEHTTIYTYATDKFHILTSKIWNNDQNTQSEIEYTVDNNGNVTSKTEGITNPITTAFQYDTHGNIIEKTIDGIYTTYYVYGTDIDGVDHKAAYLTKEYSIQDSQEIAKNYTYDFNTGNLLSSIDENGNVTEYSYDDIYRVTRIDYPNGNYIGYQYNDNWDSNKSVYKYNDERTEIFYYNIFNQLAEYKVAGTNLTITGGNIETLSQIEYNSYGKKTKEIDANGHSYRYSYDSANRLIEKTLYDNDTKKISSMTLDYDYNHDATTALLITTTDQEGYIKKHYYDILYRLIKVEETPDKTNYYTTSYTYDYVGNVTSLVDARGNTIEYTYDEFSRLINRKDALNNQTNYVYNSINKLIQETNAKGKTKYFEYDNLGRLIREKVPSTDGEIATTRYIYDKVGNLTKKILPNNYDPTNDTPENVATMSGLSYIYDSRNRLIKTLSLEGEILKYNEYNSNGQLSTSVDGLRYNENDPSSSVGISYFYEDYNLLLSKTIDALGNETNYTYDNVGNLLTTTEAKGNITTNTYNVDNTVNTITYPDGGTIYYNYDKKGQLTQTTNQRGNTTQNTYDGFGNLKTITDPYGNTTENVYDENSNLIQQIDAKGNTTLFIYDVNNRLTQTKTPLEEINGEIIYSIQEYLYDELGNVTTIKTTGTKDITDTRETYFTYYDNNLIETTSDNSGANTKNNYDKNGNLIKTEKLRATGTYDITKYEYDNRNRQTKSIYLIDESSIYNSINYANIANIRDSEYTGKVQLITAYEYDVLGNVIKTTTPNAYQYLETDTTNRDKYTTWYTYDILNRLDETNFLHDGQVVYTKNYYDELGNIIEKRDANGNSTTYTYDNMNRVKTVEGADGYKLTYQYDLAGNKISETNGKNDTMTYIYDNLNRVETIIDSYGVVITKNIYDENSNIIKTIDAKGYLSAETDEERYGATFTYDLANRLVTTIDPEIAELNDPTLYTEKYEYNQYSEITKSTDALGNETSYQYNNVGRLTKVIDALNTETTYTYDYLGNKLTMTDGRNNQTTYVYTDFNLPIVVTDADNKTINYQYDLVLNPVKIQDRNGNETIYQYNNQNLLTNKTVTGTGDSISYNYDAVGNRIAMIDATGITNYTYNANNFLTTIAKDGTTNITYTYDEAGNITSVTDYKGNITNYTYDKSNRMETVNYNISGEEGKYTYSYDENGNRKMEGINQLAVAYSFDKNNRLIAMTNHEVYAKNTKVKLIPKSTYKYTYDNNGNQLTKTDDYGTTYYTYDELNRVKEIQTPGKTTYYFFDNAGNRISQTKTYTSNQPTGKYVNNSEIEYIIKTSQYIYSNTNRLMSLVETMKDISDTEVLEATTTYTYDDNGNQLTEQTTYTSPLGTVDNPSQTKTSTYDGFNRLTQLSTQGTTVSYQYNGDDLRTSKISNGVTTNYLYDRQYVILETDANDNQKNRYIKGINYIGAVDVTNEEIFYVYNGHGDVTLTITPTWKILNQYDYDIFGNITLQIETHENAIKYAGEFYDNETGLYYLRARYYNPHTARFITEDSYWGEDNNPLSLNLYTYCHNNPIMYVDPSGHLISEMDEANLSPEDIQAIKDATDAYYTATDQAGRDAAHAAAEAIRDTYRNENQVGNGNGDTVDITTGEIVSGAVIYEPPSTPIYIPTFDSTNSGSGDTTPSPPISEERIAYANVVVNEYTIEDVIDLFNINPKDVTREVAEWLIGNPINAFITQHPYLTQFLTGVPVAAIFYAAGFVIDDDGIYHARQDALQQYGGYNFLYDIVFDYATSMIPDIFQFTYNEQDYRLWAWKGDYLNLGAGAELGLYKRLSVNGNKTDHWLADTSSTLTMSLTLKDNKGNLIASYNPSEPQWWITAFNPYKQDVNAGELTAKYNVNFENDKGMYKAFIDSNAFKDDKRWSISSNDKNTLLFTF